MRKEENIRHRSIKTICFYAMIALGVLFFLPGKEVKAQAEAGEYYYIQLNAQEKKLYEQIKDQAGNLTDDHDPGNLTVSLDEAVGSDTRIADALFAFFRDHPEYFWVDVSRIAFERDAGSSDDAPSWHLSAMSGESYFYSGFTTENLSQYRADFDKAVKEIVDAAPKGDRVLQIRYFNNWLSIHNTYNVNGLGASNFSRCAASAILSENDPQKGPVCYGYAAALKVLLNEAGIPNAFVEGTAYNDKNLPYGEQHAWNYVEVDGGWYALDPTWDDPGVKNRPATETYFLVGGNTKTITRETLPTGMKEEQRLFKNNHVAQEIGNYGLTYPTLSDDAYTARTSADIQVTLPDGTMETMSDLKTALQKAEGNPGTVIRLWKTVTVDEMLVIPDQTTIDLNAQGTAGRHNPAVAGSVSPIFTVEAGDSVSIINSGETFSAIAVKIGVSGTAIKNEGTLTLGAGVTVMGNGVGAAGTAVSGNPAQAEMYGYLPSTSGTTQTVSKVIAPESAEVKEEFDDTDQKTVQTLLNYAAAGNYAPQVKLSYWNGTTTITPLDTVQPQIEWKISAVPDGAGSDASDLLQSGRYTLQAVVKDTDSFYGYQVYRYVEVKISQTVQPVHTFQVSAPSFDAVEYGDTSVQEKELAIENTGNEAMTIVSVSVENRDGSSAAAFTVQGPAQSAGAEVTPGSVSKDWTVQPAADLEAGTHTAVITVEAEFAPDARVIQTAEVSVVIEPKEVEAVLSGDAEKTYDGTDALPQNTSLSLSFASGSVLAQDEADLKLNAGSIKFVSADAGTTEVIAENLSITGSRAGCYKLKADRATAAVTGISAAQPLVNFSDLKVGAGSALADLKAAEVTDSQGNTVQGTFTWFTDSSYTTPADEKEVLSSGSHTFWYRFTPSSPNYSKVEDTVTVEVEAEVAPQYTLEVSAPAFDSLIYGDSQTQAKAITVRNTGNREITNIEITAANADGSPSASFTVNKSGQTPGGVLAPGTASTEWTVQPVAGLGAGTHTAVIRVKAQFDSGVEVTQTAKVSVQVNPRELQAGAMTVSGGSGGTQDAFIYGDVVLVEFKFQDAQQVPADTEIGLYAESAGKAALLISGPVKADANGIYRFQVDTTDKSLAIGASDLTAVCAEQNPNFSYGEGTASMTLQPRTVQAVLSGDASKEYDGTDAIPQGGTVTLGFAPGGVLGTDEGILGLQAGSIRFLSADAGTDTVVAENISLTANEGSYYVLSADSVTAKVTGISAVSPTVSMPELALEAGSSLSDLASATVVDAQGNAVEGTFTWFTDETYTSPADMTQMLEPGTYTFWYRFVPSSGNYAEVTGSAEIQIQENTQDTVPEPVPEPQPDPEPQPEQKPGEAEGVPTAPAQDLKAEADRAVLTGDMDGRAVYVLLLTAAAGAIVVSLKKRRDM